MNIGRIQVRLGIIVMTIGLMNAQVGWAQNSPGDGKAGLWTMYAFQKKFKNSAFGLQGDYQLRLWNIGRDVEQLLLRTGVTYRPREAGILFTVGYAHVTSGQYGEPTGYSTENRIYQEALFPQKIGNRFLLTHRIRYEQRWLENQNFRTRYRYNLFLNIPLNGTELKKGIVYAALYDEVFLNGQRKIRDNGDAVEIFDRNRLYLGVGYGLRDNLRFQAGWLEQTTDTWSKGQVQLSLIHSF